jgi:hypothetical protein
MAKTEREIQLETELATANAKLAAILATVANEAAKYTHADHNAAGALDLIAATEQNVRRAHNSGMDAGSSRYCRYILKTHFPEFTLKIDDPGPEAPGLGRMIRRNPRA